MPESYTKFLAHAPVWNAFLDLADESWEEYQALKEAHYQKRFEEEVYLTTETLKRELYDLYKLYGFSPVRIKFTDLDQKHQLQVISEAPVVVHNSYRPCENSHIGDDR